MLSLKEREERKKQMGASEMYKIFNFDTQTAQDLWEYKVGLATQQELDENDAIMAGNILEEDCLKFYSKTNNIKIIMNERISDTKIPELVASLDAREEKTSIPLENKVVNTKTYEKWAKTRSYNCKTSLGYINIPKQYYLQIQTQIKVLETEVGKILINCLTDEEQENPIQTEITDLHQIVGIVNRDENVIEEIGKRTMYFMNCVKSKIRPSEQKYIEKYLF